MSKKIIDKILWIEGFYPFSMKFNLEKAFNDNEQELASLERDITSESIFKYSTYFNGIFKLICEELKKILNKLTLDKSTLINLLIASLNREELIISEDTNRSLNSGISFDSNMLANVYIQKPEFQNKSESVWGLIDSSIDTTNLNLNYLNHVRFKENIEFSDELSQIDIVKNIGIIGSSYNALKQAYDKIIWRGCSIEDGVSGIKLVSNHQNLMLGNVALTRLTRNIANTINELKIQLEKHKLIIKTYHKTRHFQMIKSIEGNNGDFILRYQAKSKNPTDSFISFTAPIITYYPFFHLEKISAFDNLTILDLINLFSNLYDFVEKLPMPKYEDTEVKDIEKFRRFNPMVKKSLLLGYFIKTMKYSEKQILIFLKLLTYKSGNHNLFLYSIYEEGDYYFFSHSTIKRANMLYLVDKWLDVGNCDLADRGFKFEDYIINFIKNEKLNEFAKFKIIEQHNFSFVNDKNIRVQEEIDLVLKTKTTIIIAEIKCTTYPFESNDFYSSFQTIKKAKKQVVRKAKFIEDNWSKFEISLGRKGERRIEKIIIVNNPHYAGRIIDDIPIADFYLFLSYFKSGKFTQVKFEWNKPTMVYETPYYDSINSFENNFSDFFRNPIPIKDLVSRQFIEEYNVTLNGIEPKTIAERVVYKEKIPENE
ncbi:hypothetical protein [Gelidibacter japonicus]|uniref:hypothetical protein n=1 Tax=Gelidibacter japonicus TaxID=1962232 RepID=UPI003A9408FB